MSKTINQKVKFKAPTEVIYNLLTDSKKYAALTGKKAVMGKKAGAAFSVYDGQATGIDRPPYLVPLTSRDFRL